MATTFRAVFDGEVLRPEEPLELRPTATYVVTVEGEAEAENPGDPDSETPYALTEIGRLAIDMGVDDLAVRHDWYAHGRLPDDTP